MTGLTEFQAEVARLFFSQPSSDGFLLGGGGAPHDEVIVDLAIDAPAGRPPVVSVVGPPSTPRSSPGAS